MGVHCVVFELRREPEEYAQFFKHLDGDRCMPISPHCRLLYSPHSPEAVKDYLQHFIYPKDLLLVVETTNRWALNQGFEATEWLRELQHFHQRFGGGVD